MIATRRSASEAADLAREAAQSFPKWGFHKPTRAWWGADGGQIHRFHVAEAHAKAGLTIAVAATLAGVAVGSLVLRRRAAAGPRRAASR